MTREEAARARVAAAVSGMSYRRAQIVAEIAEDLVEEEQAARARGEALLPKPKRRRLATSEVLAEVTGRARS